jgi:hypothetical protein
MRVVLDTNILVSALIAPSVQPGSRNLRAAGTSSCPSVPDDRDRFRALPGNERGMKSRVSACARNRSILHSWASESHRLRIPVDNRVGNGVQVRARNASAQRLTRFAHTKDLL